MDEAQIIRNLRLQLLIERIVIAVIAFALMAVWVHGRMTNSKSLILVDGKPVVCLLSAEDAQGVLRDIKSQTGLNPKEIQFRQDVAVARAPRDARPVSRHKALGVVRKVVSPVVPRWAIVVDGRPVVAVPDRETAGEALDMAKLRYGKLVRNLAEEPQFKENVTVTVESVDPAIYRKTADEALKCLFAEGAPVTKESVYIVRKGDVAGAIASRHGIKLDDLTALNPQRDLTRLQIGDRLKVKASEKVGARLTVVVRDQSEEVRTVPAPVQRVSSASLYSGQSVVLSPGRDGKSRVTVATIYENGRRAGSEVLDEQVIREALPKRIAVGIKPRRNW